MSPVEKVIEAYGGASALARRLGISRNAVALWRKVGRLPLNRVDEIASITGLPKHELRPDAFSAPTAGAAA